MVAKNGLSDAHWAGDKGERKKESERSLPSSEAVAVDKLDRSSASTRRVESMRIIITADTAAPTTAC